MSSFNAKSWLMTNIEPFLKVIKTELSTLSSVTGQYAGSGATFAGLPSEDLQGTDLLNGDWSALTVDDIGTGTVASPQYPAGVYVTDGTTWALVAEHQDINDVLVNIIATDAEVLAGTALDKVGTVDQLNRFYARLNGNASNLFSATAGELDTDNVLNANQFATADNLTQAEACTMWDGLDVSSPPCVVASATFTGFDVETSTFTNQGMNTPNFYVHNSDDVELGITLTALATTGMVYPLTVTVELDQTLNSPAVTVPASTPHGFLRSVQTWAGYMRTYNSGSANVLLDSTSLLDQSATDTLATAGDTFHVSVEAVGGDVWVDEWLSWKITATDANGAEVVLNTTTTGGMSSANDILVTDTSIGVNVHMTQ